MDKNAVERISLVKAMEFICRNINDEDIFFGWLLNGVADGDIPYGSLTVTQDDIESLDYYIEDENFSDLISCFLRCMARAKNSGGLFCDGVVG